jgi:hypothetical protein
MNRRRVENQSVFGRIGGDGFGPGFAGVGRGGPLAPYYGFPIVRFMGFFSTFPAHRNSDVSWINPWKIIPVFDIT